MYNDDFTVDFLDNILCPACAEGPQYCQGHGEIGDPIGNEILWKHDAGDHSSCVIDCNNN